MIELIQPITTDSGVAKYLARHGEGMHHICLEVDDVHRTLEEFAGRNVQLINEEPIRAAEGFGFFLHPRSQPRRVDRVPRALREGGPGI